MRCLVITSNHPNFATYSYYQDWQTGFLTHPQLKTSVLDIQNPRTLLKGAGLAGRYDLVVFLHSVFLTLTDTPRLKWLKWLLTAVGGERVFFLSNEFRALRSMTGMADYLGASTIISQLNQDDAELLYQTMWSKRILCLPYGFTTTLFKPEKKLAERSIDIGFRGDYYPAYVGHDDRDLLLDQFNTAALKYKPTLRTDIQVGDRLETAQWAEFLNNCRSLIGHEAGSMRLEEDESTRRFLNAQQQHLSPEKFRQLAVTMREAGVFAGKPSGRIAAPRNFEAMGTKTLQILLTGRYNDVLEPNVHYLELKRDFSNLAEVIEQTMDEATYHRLTERAYADALAQHTYEQRINTLLHHILG